MEKTENRKRFVAELPGLVTLLKKWDNYDRFEDHLKRDPLFRETMDQIKGLQAYERIVFILTELTRKRVTCNKIADILFQNGQTDVSNKLRQLNTSSGVNQFTYDVYLRVVDSVFPDADMSQAFELTQNPRGMCVIINNVEDRQSPQCVKGLKLETERFQMIFAQLKFTVEVLTNLNVDRIVTELERIKEKRIQERDQAFVLMVVTHGENEEILGFDACDANRKLEFGQTITANEANNVSTDRVRIERIVDLFNKNNCPKLVGKPKMFVFDCCRICTPSVQLDKSQVQSIPVTSAVVNTVPKTDNFVCYAVQKGFTSDYNSFHGITNFGQAFSHSIAQYACDQPLNGIMNRTATALREMCAPGYEQGSFAIELRQYAMSKNVFFNPGH